jgi:hypothetical protein
VAYIGIAPDIHQMLMIKTTAAAFLAATDIPAGSGRKRTTKNTINPLSNPMYFFESILQFWVNYLKMISVKRKLTDCLSANFPNENDGDLNTR